MTTGPFLSSSWYRVANLRPRLREHGELHRHTYRGVPTYVLFDRAKGTAHRLPPASYRIVANMDGRHSVNELWTDVANHVGEEAPSQDEVIGFLAELNAADLIQFDVSPDSLELLDRHARFERSQLKQRILNPLSIRLPLWDPDNFLERNMLSVRWLFSWLGAVLWIVVTCAAGVLALQHASALGEGVSDRILAAQNIVLIALTYPFVKALHELGHGFAVKAYGGAVHEMGVMLLVFFPVPYVDASAASRFQSKHQRMLVGAAGILVELFLAAIAMFVWALAEPGMVRAIAFNVMLIAGVSTLLFNGNPLLRYDGYYVLADFLEIPNLAQRSGRYLSHLVDRYIFGSQTASAFSATPGECFWFLLYAPVSFVYRQFIMLAIALFVASEYLVVGVLLAIWSVATGLLYPIFKGLRHVVQSPVLASNRRRAVTITFGVLAACSLLLFVVPAPLRTMTEGVVWLPEEAIVRAGTDGFATRLAVGHGDQVSVDDVLFQSEEPELRAHIVSLRARVAELEAQLASERFADRVQAAVTGFELSRARQELENEERRVARLTVRSKASGRFSIVKPRDLPGRFLREGQVVAYILPSDPRVVRVAVLQEDIDLVRQRLKGVSVRLAESIGQTMEARVIREVPAGRDELPSRALSTSGGGTLPADPRDNSGTKTLQRVFQFDLELAASSILPVAFGGRAYVRFEHHWEPLGQQLWRRLRQLFLARLQY